MTRVTDSLRRLTLCTAAAWLLAAPLVYAQTAPVPFAPGYDDFAPVAAKAAGQFETRFCVPKPGWSTCDGTSDPNSQDLPVSFTFRYAARRSNARTAPHLAAGIKDEERSVLVAYQTLLSGGLPEADAAEKTRPHTFTVLVKRGRTYAFQVFANGPVSVSALQVKVAPDWSRDLVDRVTTLEEGMTSLQDQVGSLGKQAQALETQIAGLGNGAQGPDGPQGPAGPQGPQGTPGHQGPAGPRGEGLVAGSILMVAAGTPAPANWTFLGTTQLELAGKTGPGEPKPKSPITKGSILVVDVYRFDEAGGGVPKPPKTPEVPKPPTKSVPKAKK